MSGNECNRVYDRNTQSEVMEFEREICVMERITVGAAEHVKMNGSQVAWTGMQKLVLDISRGTGMLGKITIVPVPREGSGGPFM